MPKEVDAVAKLYALMLWFIPRLDKFPRNRKFILGDRMENLMLDVLELLVEAAYSRAGRKKEALHAANLKLEKLRYLIRLSKDLQLINLKTYEAAARAVEETGRSVGGWLRYAGRENPQPAD